MEEKVYRLKFDGSGSTSVRARTPHDAISVGRLIAGNGCKNVEIITRNDKSYTLDQFYAGMVAAGKAHDEQR